MAAYHPGPSASWRCKVYLRRAGRVLQLQQWERLEMPSKPLIVHSTNISGITMEVTLASRNHTVMRRIGAIPRCMVRIKTFTLSFFWRYSRQRWPTMMLIRHLGDPRGVGLVVDICEPEPGEKSGHFLIPRIRPTHIDQDTIEYLRRKGVFDLPTPAVCEMMIRTYFHYVHPFFPVVDAHSFLDTFENEPSKVSVHLLWSMFLAAANVWVSPTPSLPSQAT